MKDNILYYKNEVKIKEVENFLNYSKDLIQNALDSFKKLDIQISLEELKGLFNEYRQTDIKKVTNLVKEKLVIGKENVGGLSIDAESLKQLIKTPNLTALMKDLDKFKLPLKPRLYHALNEIYWNAYEIDKKGKVKILPIGFNYLTNGFIHVASTSDQINRVIEVQKICEILQAYFIKDEIKAHLLCDPRFVMFENGKFYPGKNYINTGCL